MGILRGLSSNFRQVQLEGAMKFKLILEKGEGHSRYCLTFLQKGVL